MNRFESLARRLVLFWGLALGCDSGSGAPPPAPPSTGEPEMTERAGAAPGSAAPHPTDAADPATGVAVTDPAGPAPGVDDTNVTVTMPGSASAVYAEIEADIRALKSLAIAQVRHLVVDGAHASSCYGLHPCAASATEPSVAAEYARQAPRLDRLTAIAQAAASAAQTAPAGGSDHVAADLAALNALRIVSFGQLITAAPANNPSCYNLPCASDVAVADAENARRAAVLHAFAREATAAGL